MADGSKKLLKYKSPGIVSRDWQNSRVRFTHNEIERKRRARLKSETDFLHQQLPKAPYRDKLAIFKAGTELLLRYSNSSNSETRSLILTDSEYSECILNNFNGFGLIVKCSDGAITMSTRNWKLFLGTKFTSLTGKSLFDLIVPSDLTKQIISSALSVSSEERDHLSAGQIVPRCFILPINDDRYYECCGDIVPLSSSENDHLLHIMCRALDCPKSQQFLSADKVFSLRLQPDSYVVMEYNGRVNVGELSSEYMLGRSLLDLSVATSRTLTESHLRNAERVGEAAFNILLQGSLASPPSIQQFLVLVKTITVCDRLQCLLAEFYPPQ